MNLNSITLFNGSTFLDIPQRRELEKAYGLYFGHSWPQRNALTKNGLWNALNDYVQFCIDYFTSVLNGKIYTPDDVAPTLFVVDFENIQQYQKHLKVAIFVAKEYALDLQRRLNRSEIDAYEELILTIESDFENLIVDYERYVKKQNRNVHATIGSRNYHLVSDGKWAAQSMVFIEHELSAKKPDFRGIRPYSLFIVRQCLEIAGNNIIGFYRVMDRNGNDIHKFTQIGWKFLSERARIADDVKGWNIILPFKVETIRALVNWSNSFVHTMRFYTCYIQYYAMDMMWKVLQPAHVDAALGSRWSSEFGEFYIENYRNLKRDFEHYVKVENGNKDATIIWKPLHQVGAYIKSIGPGKVLYVMHMPPPVHGASMMGQYIKDSHLLQARFDSEYINMAAATDLNDIGHVGIKKIVNYGKMLRRIRKSVRNAKPHVIYVTPNSAGMAFYKDFVTVSLIKYWIRRSSCNTKILVHYHNKGVKDFSKSKVNDWLYRRFFSGLHVLLLGETLYDDVKKYVPASRVRFCGNGIPELSKEEDNRVIERMKERQKEKTEKAVHILFLSNMMEEKGVWALVDACKILKEKGIAFQCTFVGGWKDITEDAFNQRITDLGLQSELTAVGPKYGKEKEPYWMDADVFVAPSYNECFPLVLLEAMQHALPCISTNVGAIPDIIDNGKTGFVVNKKNAGHLAAKIMELVEDKGKQINMGLNGYRKFKEQYTLKMFENRLSDVLEQLM